ncbi:MAG: nuclear transport factor 2 family protein, partial [Pseudomonas sp.]
VDGSAAAGQWIMQQISTYADQRSELFGTRLAIDFRRVDGTWLIAHFRTQRLFNSMLGVNP